METISLRIMTLAGIVAMSSCLNAVGSHSQSSGKPKLPFSETRTIVIPTITSLRFAYPYYEWTADGIALGWIQKPNGSVVAMPLNGTDREERRIGGASDLKGMGAARPHGLKMSLDGSKILYLEGFRGSQAGGWRAGDLKGTAYTRGPLLFAQSPDLVWKSNSSEWVSIQPVFIVNGELCGTVTHYYTDGVTPPKNVAINPALFERASMNDKTYTSILGLRKDGIAIVPVRNALPRPVTIDIYLIDIERGRVLPEKHHVKLPEEVFLREMVLSHAADRIAWLFDTEVVHVVNGVAKTENVLSVWLSHADGSDLKRLPGFTPYMLEHALPDQPESQLSVDCPIRWTFQDTAISCLEGDKLQVIQVK
jgi:hypothetical protein